MPAERPRCAWCDRQLRPYIDVERADGSWSGRVVRRTWIGWRAYEGVFDTATCAIKFAGASYRGGYRRRR
jgi:hypothetical protein